MIRLVQNNLIVPRGDTGTFSIPVLSSLGENIIGVFTILDPKTNTKIFQKQVSPSGETLTVTFSHGDTVNLPVGRYLWDIKFYENPVFVDEELVDGVEVDSYYAAYKMPICEIRQTGDKLLTADGSPTTTLAPETVNFVTAAISEIQADKNIAVDKAEEASESAQTALDAANSASADAENATESAELAESKAQEASASAENAANSAADAKRYAEQITDLTATAETLPATASATASYNAGTGVLTIGIPEGKSITSTTLNQNYTLTIGFNDGTSITVGPIRGEQGVGIESIVKTGTSGLVDIYTITYTNGSTSTFRVTNGMTPHFSIGAVTEGATAAASITGTDENPVLNLVLPNANVPTKVSELENDANYATDANYVHTDNNYTTEEKTKLSGIAEGAEVNVNADWDATEGDAFIRNKPTSVSSFTNDAGYLTTETDPTVPEWAKAATKPAYTAAEVGAPTVAEMNTAIGEAIGQINSFDMAVVQALPTQDISTHTIYLVPKTGETNDVYDEYVYINSNWEMVGNTQIDLSNYATKDELPDVPVQDVQVNGVSVLSEGVANVPSGAKDIYGVIKLGYGASTQWYGLDIAANGSLMVVKANDSDIKGNWGSYKPIVPDMQHKSAFYGLAKAAGDTTQSASSNAVGSYTDEAKEKIQSMLGISQMLAPENPNLVATQAYAIGDVFAANGHLYKATAAIAQDEAIIPDTNCVETTMVDAGGKIKDVQVAGTSIVGSDGVANISYPTAAVPGVVTINSAYSGLRMNGSRLEVSYAIAAQVKAGSTEVAWRNPIYPGNQHESTFYGLSKVAGVDLANETVTLGTYPETSKTAIKAMLGVQDGLKVVRLI